MSGLVKARRSLSMCQPFGAINYRGAGVFIAGCAGIKPLLDIFRKRLHRRDPDRQTLVYSNKTPADIIAHKALAHGLGEHCFLGCTREDIPGYKYGRIDKEFLQTHILDMEQHFYMCSPTGFMERVTGEFQSMGGNADSLTIKQLETAMQAATNR